MTVFNRSTLLASVGALALMAGAANAEQAKISGTIMDIYGPRFVLDTANGKILVEMSPRGMDKVKLKTGEKIDVEGDRMQNQLRAQRVTLADGHAYTTGPKQRTWREFVTGKPDAGRNVAFTAADAAKTATAAGYTVKGDARPERRNFVLMGTKAGTDYELLVAKNGRIEARPAFGVTEATKVATDKGFKLSGTPMAIGPKFRAEATKDGKPVVLMIERDGSVGTMTPFAAADAVKLVKDGGYELVGEPKPVDEHFEALGKKDGKFYELIAKRDAKITQGRLVDATDPRWGSMVR